ncbi:glycoside hydrolase family 3 N-terminal domain-containing protein [Limimaricola pyoseonensis]|uniref:beta-N-acetylhexosaminidase n=1 Tax=Limimaricola pyoseonensis TaxID=521013 RepID=A0A1G7ARY8_9RHOB|nr:glycoside hydrolase family 3 N-terminal domain-containing protein [Limimaricola pyoseonensis]SDE17638.1 beta-N-acetylhexosaminidase [Limimaricola pyoseonensis]
MTSACILGPSGPSLDASEAAFFREADPWGFILFARNVESRAQLRRLTGALRDALGREAPILIDQEGGRVQRMRAPHWQEFLPALEQMRRAKDPMRAQWVRHRLIAQQLNEVGIDVNCAPLADLVEPETHHILRNRLYGGEVAEVVEAARTAAEAMLAGGVLPVLKHIPGYGRARVDSHKALPRVSVPLEALRARDFAPFKALNDMAMGMTAHIVLEAVDPELPATTSAEAMKLIRDEIGFDGLLMTDDLSMEALSGRIGARAADSLEAGCDLVLHCNGDRDEMAEVVAASGRMTEAARRRGDAALAQRRAPEAADIAALEAELAELTGETA